MTEHEDHQHPFLRGKRVIRKCRLTLTIDRKHASVDTLTDNTRVLVNRICEERYVRITFPSLP